jgi:DNA polymerase I-like protein with 3'-5' exonuclease and polymerase domains/5'-3' exonuclease
VSHEGKDVHINGWGHGLDNAINSVVTTLDALNMVPAEVIFVVEGLHSKARRVAMYKDYKATRDSRPPEAYEEFNKVKEKLTQSFRDLGCQIVTQGGVEGDDVIGFLAQNLRGKKIIMSEDGDLAVLLSDDVSLWRQGCLVDENPLGPFPPKFITVYKALVGDSSDNLKGAKGFGEKAFLDMLVNFGDAGIAALEGMMKRRTLHELEEDVASFKPFRKVIDGAEHVYQSYDCAKLYPEWCDTLRQPLQWKAGMVRGRDVVTDERLVKWAQKVRLITADNYDEALKFLAAHIKQSPVVALDIETSTPPESDEWLAIRGKEDKVDVLGSKLTGMGLTFGSNGQFTYYFSVDHADTPNLTSDQVLDAVKLIPQGVFTVVHNAAFELPILYGEWGKKWADNGWQGFLPNCLDTAILSSYTDENKSQGLKKLSLELLDYEQESYDQVTTVSVPVYEAVMLEDGSEDQALVGQSTKRLKMNELSGEHVLSYGADDTICTTALYHHFRVRMELENTWDVMLDVEQLPAYVKALAFTQGVKFSLEHMLEMEADDQATYQKNWGVIREYLIEQGWEGTTCPVIDEFAPANIKQAVSIILGQELVTQVRTVSKLAKLVEVMDHDDAPLLGQLIAEGNVASVNDWMARRFEGEPVFDVGSPKKMKGFLYETMGLPVRIVNSTTEKERSEKRELAAAVSRYKKIWAGSKTERPLSPAEQELLKAKAKTDDTAVDFALLLDVAYKPREKTVLEAFKAMKTCATRQTMFYNSYRHLRHWKDGKIHGQSGQCRTVTRRDAPNDPNLSQLPKKSEGVKFRRNFLPHKKGAVVVSIDFTGQELRQGAGQSGDPGMMACFVGDNLKDMHSMTAAGAMEKKWGKAKLAELIESFGKEGDAAYDLFLRLRKADDEAVAKLADDLRKNAKNVNFGAQYDAMAAKLAETLIIPVEDAQTFLDAKYAMFPRFEVWKDEVKDEAKRLGYVTTCMGARRHLREALLSDAWGVADKALRQGPNFKIQGSSGEQTKLAQARLWKSGILFNLDMVFYFSVHDELVWSVAAEDALESIKVVHHAMTRPYGNLPVPFLGSISMGLSFGDQHELGEEVDEAKIEAKLAEILSSQVVTI